MSSRFVTSLCGDMIAHSLVQTKRPRAQQTELRVETQLVGERERQRAQGD